MKLNEVLQNGNVDISHRKLITLRGLNFDKKIIGNFDCAANKLTSLEGAPVEVTNYFDCNYNQLTSLEGAPVEVGGNFYCGRNKLASLKGAPAKVGGSFYCAYNRVTTLKGAPAEVGGHFECAHNQLTSLKDVNKVFNKIGGNFFATGNDITHAVLGLLLIDGLNKISLDNKEVSTILNKHLGKGKAGVLAAQQELIDADLEDYAEV